MNSVAIFMWVWDAYMSNANVFMFRSSDKECKECQICGSFCIYWLVLLLYIRKISLLDMHLRWHVGRAVEIVVTMGWHDLQCTWSVTHVAASLYTPSMYVCYMYVCLMCAPSLLISSFTWEIVRHLDPVALPACMHKSSLTSSFIDMQLTWWQAGRAVQASVMTGWYDLLSTCSDVCTLQPYCRRTPSMMSV
jgi:hypothetical protein